MRVVDPGHKYELAVFDTEEVEATLSLVFVKRNDPPDKYPGNEDSYPGTIIQEVLGALIERLEYVNKQFPCAETESVLHMQKTSLLLLEIRANRLHGRTLDLQTEDDIVHLQACRGCGHAQCEGECGKVV